MRGCSKALIVWDMKQSLTKLYSQLHTTTIKLARRAPIPARIFGPPKGIINDIKAWVAVQREREQLAEDDCWYQTVYAGGLRRDFTEHPQARSLASAGACDSNSRATGDRRRASVSTRDGSTPFIAASSIHEWTFTVR